MSFLNVLFWNVQKKDLTKQIVNIVKYKKVDILVLAENPVSDIKLIQALNTDVPEFFLNHPRSQCRKLTIITRFHYDFITPISESSRITIRRVNLPVNESFLFVALHSVDKRSFSTESQDVEAMHAVNAIIRAEQQYNS